MVVKKKIKEQKMNRKIYSIGFFLIAMFGLVLAGCATPTPRPTVPTRHVETVLWVSYPRIPSKDYEVVGIIVLRDVDPNTLSADLMERAAAMGAHDIKNVRIDAERMLDRRRVVAASAVAIRYTETLSSEMHKILYLSDFLMTLEEWRGRGTESRNNILRRLGN